MINSRYKQEVSKEVNQVTPPATQADHVPQFSQIGNLRSPQGSVSGAVNLDVSLYGVFNLTLTAATDFTFINLPTGNLTKPVTIYLTGAFAWTLAQGVEEIGSDAYDGAANNRIQTDIVSATKIFYQIQNL